MKVTRKGFLGLIGLGFLGIFFGRFINIFGSKKYKVADYWKKSNHLAG